MNKNTLILLLLIITPLVILSIAQDIAIYKPIYLHEQKKKVRSNEEHLKQFITAGDIILDFYADWCNPCQRMLGLIDTIAPILPQFTFIKINRDFFMDLANLFNITSIPTLIFIRNGKEIGRYDGKPLTKKELKKLILTIYGK